MVLKALEKSRKRILTVPSPSSNVSGLDARGGGWRPPRQPLPDKQTVGGHDHVAPGA